MRISSTQIRARLEAMLNAQGGLKMVRKKFVFVPRGRRIESLSQTDGYWIGRAYMHVPEEQVIAALDQAQWYILHERMPKRSALLRVGLVTPWQMWSDRPFHELVDEEARRQALAEKTEEEHG